MQPPRLSRGALAGPGGMEPPGAGGAGGGRERERAGSGGGGNPFGGNPFGGMTALGKRLQRTAQAAGASLQDASSKLAESGSQLLNQEVGALSAQGGEAAAAEAPRFVRLPVESAYKLKWYDSHQLASLIEKHLEEQQQVLDENAQLRRVLAAHVGEEQLRKEARGLHRAAAVRQAAEATNSVLVLSAQQRIRELQGAVEGLEAERAALRAEAAAAAAAAPARDGSGRGTRASSVADDGDVTPVVSPGGSGQLETPGSEDGGGSGPAAAAGPEPADPELAERHRALADKLAEAEGRAADLAARLDAALAENQRHEERELEILREKEAAKQKQQQLAAENRALEGKLKAGLAAESKKREGAVQGAEQRAAEARARAEALEADVQKSVALLRESNAKAAELQQKLGGRTEEKKKLALKVKELEGQVAKLESTAKREKVRSQKNLKSFEAGKAAEMAQKDSEMHSKTKGLESRLAEYEAKMAEMLNLRAEEKRAHKEKIAGLVTLLQQAKEDLEARDGTREDLEKVAAKNAALEAELDELQTERGQLESYRKIRTELEEGKARMEEELMATAQMVTDLEMKLQTKDHELLGLQEEMLELDAGTAKVKKQLQLEFQSKLDSMEANQALWPQAARDSISDLEGKVWSKEEDIRKAKRDLEESEYQRERLQRETADRDQRATHLENELAHIHKTSDAQKQSLLSQIQELQRQFEEASQELALKEREARTFHSPSKTPSTIQGMDFVYMKNVFMKYIEVSSKQGLLYSSNAEKAAMLPVIATLLQASSEEFATMKRWIGS